jgi:hypothetical protein
LKAFAKVASWGGQMAASLVVKMVAERVKMLDVKSVDDLVAM